MAFYQKPLKCSGEWFVLELLTAGRGSNLWIVLRPVGYSLLWVMHFWFVWYSLQPTSALGPFAVLRPSSISPGFPVGQGARNSVAGGKLEREQTEVVAFISFANIDHAMCFQTHFKDMETETQRV